VEGVVWEEVNDDDDVPVTMQEGNADEEAEVPDCCFRLRSLCEF
jgi:hypothetical protein